MFVSDVYFFFYFLGEICNNWPNDLLGAKIYNTLESILADNRC